jgi:hypothetical protein
MFCILGLPYGSLAPPFLDSGLLPPVSSRSCRFRILPRAVRAPRNLAWVRMTSLELFNEPKFISVIPARHRSRSGEAGGSVGSSDLPHLIPGESGREMVMRLHWFKGLYSLKMIKVFEVEPVPLFEDFHLALPTIIINTFRRFGPEMSLRYLFLDEGGF